MNEENKDTVNISDQFNSIQLFFVLVCSKLSYCDSLAIVWRKKLFYNERKGKEKRRENVVKQVQIVVFTLHRQFSGTRD